MSYHSTVQRLREERDTLEHALGRANEQLEAAEHQRDRVERLVDQWQTHDILYRQRTAHEVIEAIKEVIGETEGVEHGKLHAIGD